MCNTITLLNQKKREITPIFFEKMQILKRHGCQNSVAMVTSILTYTLQRLQNVPR